MMKKKPAKQTKPVPPMADKKKMMMDKKKMMDEKKMKSR